jgi:hypothetical protein
MRSKWKRVADSIILKRGTPPTDKTDETPLVIPKTEGGGTAKTDETPLSSLSSVGVGAVCGNLDISQTAKSRLAKALFGTTATEAELELMVRREVYFIEHGMSQESADYLIDRLMLRDRQSEDGRTCAECANFAAKTRLCTQPKKARLALTATSNVTPTMISVPHQCRGFAPSIKGGP